MSSTADNSTIQAVGGELAAGVLRLVALSSDSGADPVGDAEIDLSAGSGAAIEQAIGDFLEANDAAGAPFGLCYDASTGEAIRHLNITTQVLHELGVDVQLLEPAGRVARRLAGVGIEIGDAPPAVAAAIGAVAQVRGATADTAAPNPSPHRSDSIAASRVTPVSTPVQPTPARADSSQVAPDAVTPNAEAYERATQSAEKATRLNNQLNRRIAILEQELREAQNADAQVQPESATSNARLVAAERELSDLREQFATQKRQWADEKRQLLREAPTQPQPVIPVVAAAPSVPPVEDRSAEVAELESLIDELTGKSDADRKELGAATRERDGFKDQVDTLTNKVAQLEAQASERQAADEAAAAKSDAEATSQAADLKRAQTELETLRASNKKLQADLSVQLTQPAPQSVSADSTELTTVKTQLDDLRTTAAALTDEIDVLQDEIGVLRSEAERAEEYKIAAQQADADAESAQHLVERVRNDLATTKAELTELRAEHTKVQASLTQHVDELPAASKALSKTESELAKAKTQLDQTTEKLANADAALEQRQTALEKTKELLDKKQAALDETHADHAKTKAALEAAVAARNETTALLAERSEAESQAAKEHKALESERNALASERDELIAGQKQLDEAREKQAGYLEELEELVDELSTAARSSEENATAHLARLETVEAALADAEAESDRLSREVAKANERAGQANDALALSESEIERHRAEATAAAAAVDDRVQEAFDAASKLGERAIADAERKQHLIDQLGIELENREATIEMLRGWVAKAKQADD